MSGFAEIAGCAAAFDFGGALEYSAVCDSMSLEFSVSAHSAPLATIDGITVRRANQGSGGMMYAGMRERGR